MSEWVNHSWVYDASPTAMFQMLTRLDHLTEQARFLGYQQFSVLELRQRADLFRVTWVRRPVASDLARRSSRGLVRQSGAWHQPTWDGARRFETTTQIGGPGLTVSGHGELTPVGRLGTRYSIQLTVQSAGRFFFSRQAEKAVAARVAAVLEAEHGFRQDWLAGLHRATVRSAGSASPGSALLISDPLISNPLISDPLGTDQECA